MEKVRQSRDTPEEILPLRRDGNGQFAVGKFALGDRVRIVASRDIEGILIKHRRFLDGSTRWQVEYWHEGRKHDVSCMERELDLVIE